ncbi:MAG TPA: hypothetical protein VIU61_05840, partial [Kofleriaceae bacterium]
MSTTRAAPPARGPFSGPGFGPPQKAKSFRSSGRRLLGRLRPQRPLIVLVVVLAVASVALSVSGPALLGRATDIIFKGFFGQQLPADQTHDQAVAALHESGNHRTANLVHAMGVTPGRGIDFDALAEVLGFVLALYVG